MTLNENLVPFVVDDNLTKLATITAVGIGSLGSSLTQLLNCNLANIDCYHMEDTNNDNPPANLTKIHKAIEKSDLLFILSDVEGSESMEHILTLGRTAQSADCPAVGIFPDMGSSYDTAWVKAARQVLNCSFTTSSRAMTDNETIMVSEQSKSTLDRYAMRHIVAMLTDLIQLDSPICVDYADIVYFLKSGTIGKMGVGIATNSGQGKDAALFALDRLKSQGVEFSEIKGLLMCVFVSGNISIDVFNDASEVAAELFDEDVCFMTGHLTDYRMGDNVKVAILTLI